MSDNYKENLKQSTRDLIFPPRGFILQKDIYSTNLLYANNQFPLTCLKKTLPFRPTTLRKPDNPNKCLQILRQNGIISDSSEEEKTFYSFSSFKPKKFNHQRLRFPLPKINVVPLSNSILYQDICNKNVKIKYIDDDLNIPSKNGKKIIYKIKDSNYSKLPALPIVNHSNSSLNINKKEGRNLIKGMILYNKRSSKNESIIEENKNIKNLLPLRQVISELNDSLKLIKKEEKERKRSFIKDNIFKTQISVEKNKNYDFCNYYKK